MRSTPPTDPTDPTVRQHRQDNRTRVVQYIDTMHQKAMKKKEETQNACIKEIACHIHRAENTLAPS